MGTCPCLPPAREFLKGKCTGPSRGKLAHLAPEPVGGLSITHVSEKLNTSILIKQQQLSRHTEEVPWLSDTRQRLWVLATAFFSFVLLFDTCQALLRARSHDLICFL